MSALSEAIPLMREFHPLAYSLFVFVFGACIGSFLNVVIYRVPAGRSVVFPGSHCACGAPVRCFDNIPVLSWVLLRGRARCCGCTISVRYPLVEAFTGLLFVAVWWRFDPLAATVFSLYVSGLVALSFIDLDTMEIPDRFTVGGFLIGAGVSMAVPSLHLADPSGVFAVDALRGLFTALQGAFIGSGLILWVALVAEVVLRKEAMGFGDVKLMGAIGAFCGWEGAVFSLFGGAILGTAFIVPLAVRKFFQGENLLPKRGSVAAEDAGEGEREGEDEGWRIPFGPSLAGGSLLYLLWLQEPFDAYVHAFTQLLADF
ncbi:MAG: prepilin peptidase [Opitutales bacterium]|nr:prepilin peptidase [Opitutales bacterium]